MVEIEKSLMLFTHYLLGYVGTVICSIGLVLALCSVYIFTRRQMRSAVSTYLAGLSFSDSCLLSLGLIFSLNYSIPPNQQSESYYSSSLHKHLFPYVYACIIWFQFTSVWITIGFAVDRWFAIKWPMLHYTYSSKRASYIVLIIYLLGLVYSLPRFFEYKAEVRTANLTVLDNYTESITYVVITNKLHNDTVYQYTVHLILKSLFQSLLPLLMLSYFNVELIRSVNASSHFLKRCTPVYGQSTRNGGETNLIRFRESVITRSVICLIGLFIICQVPASILNYIYMFYRHHKWLYICYDISNFLVFLNSAVNFFIFTFFNRKFRRELARVCFHTKNRSHCLCTSNRPNINRSSSNVRTPQQHSPLDIIHPDYWEYQKRLNKRSSQSEYHLNTLCKRSGSITNQPLKYGRHSICEYNQQRKSKMKDIRRSSNEKYLLHPLKYSLSSNTSAISYYNHEQPLQYIKCRHDNHLQKLSPSMTATSNLTENSRRSFRK